MTVAVAAAVVIGFFLCHFHFIAVLATSHLPSHTYCPVSNALNFSRDALFHYPIDVMQPQLFSEIQNRLQNGTVNDKEVLQSQLYNCFEKYSPLHTCFENYQDSSNNSNNPINKSCPLQGMNIHTSVNRSKEWMYKQNEGSSSTKLPFLYHIWAAMQATEPTKEPIRIIIFGGSAADGGESFGCHCDPKLEEKCNVFDSLEKEIPFSCAWGNYITAWLRTLTNVDIEVLNLSRHGVSPSKAMQHVMSSGIAFTRRDIIFLDFSLNELRTYIHKIEEDERDTGLESFIVLLRSLVSKDETQLPAIFLTETTVQPSPTQVSSGVTCYADSNTKIGRHYNLPIISIRDLVWSQYVATKQSPVLKSFLQPRNHPTWYLHLFVADVIAGVMLTELNRAKHFHATQLVGQSAAHISAITNPKVPPLPPRVANADTTQYCDMNTAMLLDLAPADFLSTDTTITRHSSHRKHAPVGWFRSFNSSDGSWLPVEDRAGKFGWVDEFPPGYSFEGKNMDSKDRGIRFYLNDTHKKILNTDARYALMVEYLKTHHNAGHFRIDFCGKQLNFHGAEPLGTNTLWVDWEKRKISIPQYLTFDLQHYIRYCEQKEEREQVTFVKDGDGVSTLLNHTAMYFIDIIHVADTNCVERKNGVAVFPFLNISTCKARTRKQKVKITSVKVCRVYKV